MRITPVKLLVVMHLRAYSVSVVHSARRTTIQLSADHDQPHSGHNLPSLHGTAFHFRLPVP